MKAMQQTLQRKQERENKKQRAEERLQQQQQELQTELETINDEGTMQEQQQKMEQMRVLVTEELDKGDTDAGGPEPDIYSQALFPVQVSVKVSPVSGEEVSANCRANGLPGLIPPGLGGGGTGTVGECLSSLVHRAARQRQELSWF
jgi:hypothetical protein